MGFAMQRREGRLFWAGGHQAVRNHERPRMCWELCRAQLDWGISRNMLEPDSEAFMCQLEDLNFI